MVITGFAVAIDKRFFYRNAIDIWLVVSKKCQKSLWLCQKSIVWLLLHKISDGLLFFQ